MKEKKPRKKSVGETSPTDNNKNGTTSPEKQEEIVTNASLQYKPQPVLENPDEPTLTEIIIESYEGEKVDSHFEGVGKAKFINGNTYEGMFLEGMMHGNGVFTWADSRVVYEGDFFQNQITGSGLYFWPDGSTYDGQVLNGIRHGTGTFRHPSGLAYVGEWKNGKRCGMGRINYSHDDSSFYEGEWRQNIRHGQGFRQYATGNTYKGAWYQGRRHGYGVMSWFDRDEMYEGQWEDGVQHGVGQHTWFVRRVKCSQYSLRNVYDGEFVKGKRQGFGVFYYPNGARYEGYWNNNMKHGFGKFVFKNGRIYEGEFVNDKMQEFPNFSMSGRDTPDQEHVRTRTPTINELCEDNNSVHSRGSSAPTFSPSFQLYTQHIFQDVVTGEDCDIEEERNQIMGVLLRNYSTFRRMYDFYSRIGSSNSKDNTFVMNQMQFWRFLKDCKLHEGETTLAEIDRLLAHSFARSEPPSDIHNPSRRILYFQFVNFLVTIAFHFYGEALQDKAHFVAESVSKFVYDNVMPWAGKVRGHVFSRPSEAEYCLKYVEDTYEIYRQICRLRLPNSKEIILTLRQFLLLLKDLSLINNDLTAATVVQVLSADDPRAAADDFADMEREMTFLEFFEALVGSAPYYATSAAMQQLAASRGDLQGVSEVAPTLGEDSEEARKLDGGALSQASPAASAISSSAQMAPEDKKSEVQPAAPADKKDETKLPASERGSRKGGPGKGTGGGGGGSRSQKNQKGAAAATNEKNAAPASNATPAAVASGSTLLTGSNEALASADQEKGGVSSSALGAESGENDATGEGGDLTKTPADGDLAALLDSVVLDSGPPETEEERKARELNQWMKQIDFFFAEAFFPAANQYIFIMTRLLKQGK